VAHFKEFGHCLVIHILRALCEDGQLIAEIDRELLDPEATLLAFLPGKLCPHPWTYPLGPGPVSCELPLHSIARHDWFSRCVDCHVVAILRLLLQRLLHVLACWSVAKHPQRTNTDGPDPILESISAKHLTEHLFGILEPARRLRSATPVFLSELIILTPQIRVG
jgi:hypothetical protein